VVVSSTKIEPQSGGERLEKVKELRREYDDDPPVWAGLLRTPFTELEFPKPAK